MLNAARFFHWVADIAFAVLGAVAIRDWVRRRDRLHAHLALALGLLGAVAILEHLTDLIQPASQTLTYLTIPVFMASGYGLLLLRHDIMPLSQGVHRAARIAASVAVAATFAVDLPPSALHPHYNRIQTVVLTGLIGVWAVFVGEPAWRFWQTARTRARVQRARLRALSLGYGGIVLALLFAALGRNLTHPTASTLALEAFSVILVPVMYAAIAPPRFLRRLWRAPEEEKLRAAVADLLARSTETDAVVHSALNGAIDLVGAHAGILLLPDVTNVAARGLTPDEAADLTDHVRGCTTSRMVTCDHADGCQILAVPLTVGDTTGVLALVSGPFTPMFGADELETLARFGTSVAAALDRVHLLDALRREKARADVLLESVAQMGEGIVISRDGRIIWANEAMSTITGFSLDELQALPSFLDLIPASHRAEIAERARQRIAGDSVPDHYETVITHRAGHEVDLEVAVKLVHVQGRPQLVGLCRDVTERVRTAERDRRRADQMAVLARETQVLAGNLDPATLTEAIASSARIIVRARHSSLILKTEGEPPSLPRSGPGDSGIAVPLIRRGEVLAMLYLSDKEDGTSFDEMDEAVAIGFATYAAEVLSTARTFSRERDLVARLQEMDKVKNAFMTAVSHELRTPLTSVIGFASTLVHDRGRFTEDERREMTDRLLANANKLERLLSDLLDLDRLQRGIVQPVCRDTDLAELALHVVEEYEGHDGRQIHLDLEAVTIAVDGPKVERIVENLLTNAFRHTRHGTPIWVRVHREAGGALLCVEDAGDGVPEAIRTKIFEPFQQGAVAQHSPGVGIGLSLVGRFAELHRGRAWVEEREGGGASFRVFLPGAVSGATPGARPSFAPPPAAAAV